jgi:hypothetical protein
MRLLPLVVFLFLAFPAAAQQDVEDARRTIAVIEDALKQRPEDPTLWFYLSRFQAQAGDKAASVAALERVFALGEGFLPPRDGFEKVWEDAAFQAVRAKLEAKLPRLDFHPNAVVVEDRALVPEGIAFDPKSHDFFMGSIAQRRIVRVDPTGRVSEFAGAAADLDHVLGLTIDLPRRILYAVSTSALTDAGEARRRNAIVAFDVDTGRLLRRVDVPAANQLNDVTVARGGRVFTSDSGSGAVFEIPRLGPARLLVAEGQIRGTNGLAAAPDAKRLYVAHSTGIALVDIETGAVKRVNVPARETVAAIDGLYEWQGSLVGVQNITTPGRVIYMDLSPDGATITRVRTLVSHHHAALDEPTTGAPSELGFYLLAATGVAHFNRQGKLERPESIPRPVILKVPLPR